MFADVDDTIIEAHGDTKQGAGSDTPGLSALLATATTKDTAPVILAERLHGGGCVRDLCAWTRPRRTIAGIPTDARETNE